MKRLLCLFLLLIILLLACGPSCSGTTTSTVIGKSFEPAHTDLLALLNAKGEVELTYVPVPDKWYLEIEKCCKEDDWCRIYEERVSESDYNNTSIGNNY